MRHNAEALYVCLSVCRYLMDWSIHTNNGTAVEFRIEEQDAVLLSRDPSYPGLPYYKKHETSINLDHHQQKITYDITDIYTWKNAPTFHFLSIADLRRIVDSSRLSPFAQNCRHYLSQLQGLRHQSSSNCFMVSSTHGSGDNKIDNGPSKKIPVYNPN